mmetsp:Transcript_3478/g.7674  ORF Transcript_3478/g.7674 Transcript_3478/m.7674 type:complete len:409 (-) Transcript_3478:75-1301(-)
MRQTQPHNYFPHITVQPQPNPKPPRTMTKKRTRRPQPLAPPPQSSVLRSRKRARQVTTQFHKFTQGRDAAVARAKAGGCHIDLEDEASVQHSNSSLSPRQIELLDEVKKWDGKLSEIGGREEYQRASQMNTSLFSTSKWVMGILGRWGWLDGMPFVSDSSGLEKDTAADAPENHQGKKSKKEKIPRRDVRILEVGAINTQLLDAAARTRIMQNLAPDNKESQTNTEINTFESNERNSHINQTERVYHLDVKAIDIRATDPRIQEMNFFDLPLPDTSLSSSQHYDVIVNSMVINCVTTPAQRGQMLALCYKHLRPGGVLFLTLPRLCLVQSKFMSPSYFEEILTKGVGFEVLHDVARESPKIAFFVLRRPLCNGVSSWNDKFTRTPIIHRLKKFRNTFAVTLSKEEVVG